MDYGLPVAARDAIVDFLDDLLEAGTWDDYGPNGMQVPGAEQVELVVTGVSAHAELFRLAAGAGAQMVICHHGILWDGGPRTVTPQLKGRLEALFEADLSLLTYHLPLDAHPEVGNNALICEALGLEREEPFGRHRGRELGFVGRHPEGLDVDELIGRCRSAFGREPLHFPGAADRVTALGIVSGGGASSHAEAAARGLDAFLTGEPAEQAMADARETGVHFIAAGHYATETFGVRRLGDLIAGRFGIAHRFIEIANPV